MSKCLFFLLHVLIFLHITTTKTTHGKWIPNSIRKERLTTISTKRQKQKGTTETSTGIRVYPMDFESMTSSRDKDMVFAFYSHKSELIVLDRVLERLRDETIYTLKVDFSEFNHYNISFAPCVKKYHRDSESISTYRGILEYEPLKRWLQYYRYGPIASIDSKETLNRFNADVGGVFALGTYEAGQGLEYLAFLNAAEFDEIPFATCKSKDILTSTLGITEFPSVVLVRDGNKFKTRRLGSSDEEKKLDIITFRGQLQSTKQIDTFVLHNQIPRVLRWSKEIHEKIFTSPYNRRVLLFADDNYKDLDNAMDVFERVSELLTSILHGSSMSPIFVHIPSNILDMSSHFGITRDQLPALAFVAKRQLSTDVLTTIENVEYVTIESVLTFLIQDSKLFEGISNVNMTVTDLMMSMRDKVLRSVSGDTFEETVMRNGLDTLVLFRKNNRQDDPLKMAYLEAAEMSMGIDFAEVDSTTEIIDPFLIPIDDQRGIVMFTANEKRVRYVGLPRKGKLIEFITSTTTSKIVDRESEETCVNTIEDGGSVEDEANALLRWFRENKLSRWIRSFVELGVESLDDLRYITRNDMVGMGMAVVHQRKFFAAYSKLNLPAIEVLE